jgi:hypothetical protein
VGELLTLKDECERKNITSPVLEKPRNQELLAKFFKRLDNLGVNESEIPPKNNSLTEEEKVVLRAEREVVYEELNKYRAMRDVGENYTRMQRVLEEERNIEEVRNATARLEVRMYACMHVCIQTEQCTWYMHMYMHVIARVRAHIQVWKLFQGLHLVLIHAHIHTHTHMHAHTLKYTP